MSKAGEKILKSARAARAYARGEETKALSRMFRTSSMCVPCERSSTQPRSVRAAFRLVRGGIFMTQSAFLATRQQLRDDFETAVMQALVGDAVTH